VTEIRQRLVAMYGDSVPNYYTLTRWFKEFTHGHQSLEGWPPVWLAFGCSESNISRYCRKTM